MRAPTGTVPRPHATIRCPGPMPISKRVARFKKRVTNRVTRHIAHAGFTSVAGVDSRPGSEASKGGAPRVSRPLPCLRALAPSRANAPSGSPRTPLPRRLITTRSTPLTL